VCSLPEADESLTLGPHYPENRDSRDPKIRRDLNKHTRLLQIKVWKSHNEQTLKIIKNRNKMPLMFIRDGTIIDYNSTTAAQK